MLIDTATKEKCLRSIADEALEYFDRGDRQGAFECFLEGVKRQPGTASLAHDTFILTVVRAGCLQGREAFEEAILGCSG